MLLLKKKFTETKENERERERQRERERERETSQKPKKKNNSRMSQAADLKDKDEDVRDLRDLRELCHARGYPRWRRASKLRLMRFLLRRPKRANKLVVHHSLDMETCEELGPDQRRIAICENVSGAREHRFAFEPLQLLRLVLTTGEFRNPLTRVELRDSDVRRLGHLCEGSMTFELNAQTHLVTPNLVLLRDDIAMHARFRFLCEQLGRDALNALLTQRTRRNLHVFATVLCALQQHDRSAFHKLTWECFQRAPTVF